MTIARRAVVFCAVTLVAVSALGSAAYAVTNPPHGHYVKDILGNWSLVCDAGYYGTSGSAYGGPADRCSPIPRVAHGHYEKDIIGGISLVCDAGYYGTSGSAYGGPADRCSPIPGTTNGHYEKDILGDLVLVCNAGYYGTLSGAYGGPPDRCSRIPRVAHGHYEKDILGELVLECDGGYYGTGGLCRPTPRIAHGHYTTDILGNLTIVCNTGYYQTGNSCIRLPASSSATLATVSRLPAADRFDGKRSIKDGRLATVLYIGIRQLRAPIMLNVACWNASDFAAVAASVGAESNSSEYTVSGFWTPRAPRWISIGPDVCSGIQSLMDSQRPTRRNAADLAIALHEAFHAHGIRNEAQATCDAVQAVPYAGRAIGFSNKTSSLLGALALAQIKAVAAPGYWNNQLCRDGGAWDFLPTVRNLG